MKLVARLCRLSGGRSVTTAVTVEERLGVGPAGGADKLEGRRMRRRHVKEAGSQEVGIF